MLFIYLLNLVNTSNGRVNNNSNNKENNNKIDKLMS